MRRILPALLMLSACSSPEPDPPDRVATRPAALCAAPCDWLERQELTPSDGMPNDRFATDVALGQTRLVVGSMGADPAGNASGAAYVFELGAQWTATEKLAPADASSGQFFGARVSIDADRVAVGAWGDAHAGANSGAAYVFDYDSAQGRFVEQARLTASDAASGTYFGYDVAVEGDWLAVGAWGDAQGGTTAGAVYTYQRQANGNWQEGQKLIASDASDDAWLGTRVALQGGRLVASASHDDEVATDAGAAYVFELSGSTWSEVAKLTVSNAAPNDQVSAVGVHGDVVAVGVARDDERGADAGAVHVFESNGAGGFVEVAKLFASDAGAGDWFGAAVSAWGERVAVGAHWADPLATNSGSGYVFWRSGTGWLEEDLLRPAVLEDGDRLGNSIALGEDWAAVGSFEIDSGRPGSAYVFETPVASSGGAGGAAGGSGAAGAGGTAGLGGGAAGGAAGVGGRGGTGATGGAAGASAVGGTAGSGVAGGSAGASAASGATRTGDASSYYACQCSSERRTGKNWLAGLSLALLGLWRRRRKTPPVGR